MEKVVLGVAVITGGIVLLSGASPLAAAISGAFWGAIAFAVLWARDRWRTRRA